MSDPSVCAECHSTYIMETSAMAALCPECAHWLYGYPPCEHAFETFETPDRKCSRCGWNGTRSVYVQTMLIRLSPKGGVSD